MHPSARDDATLQNIDAIFALFNANLENDDSYLYLAAINGLVAMAAVAAAVAAVAVALLVTDPTTALIHRADGPAGAEEGYAPPVRHTRKAGGLLPALATSAKLGKSSKFEKAAPPEKAPKVGKVGKAGKATANGLFWPGAFNVTWAYDLDFHTTDLVALEGIVRSRLMIAGGTQLVMPAYSPCARPCGAPLLQAQPDVLRWGFLGCMASVSLVRACGRCWVRGGAPVSDG